MSQSASFNFYIYFHLLLAKSPHKGIRAVKLSSISRAIVGIMLYIEDAIGSYPTRPMEFLS